MGGEWEEQRSFIFLIVDWENGTCVACINGAKRPGNVH